MASPGHRANVLTAAFTHGGVGAAAADGQSFLGSVQNTRMYTELFLQAPSAAPAPPPPAPAPPPSGGGGGGGGSAQPAQPAAQVQPAPTAKPKPKPKLVAVSTPRRPVSSAGLDGASVVVAVPHRIDLATRLTADETAAARAAAMVAASDADNQVAANADLEVRAEAASEVGLLEGIVGAVIGFLFG
jgi:hypothetical protein